MSQSTDCRRRMDNRETKTTVVLLHCTGSNGGQWDRLREKVSDRFQVLAPDQWGCGDREAWPAGDAFSLSAEAVTVNEILDSAAEPVHLVGHSYGGALALHIARHRPERLKSLSLIEPSAFHLLLGGTSVDEALLREITAVAADVNRALRSGNHWAGMSRFVDYWSGKGTWDGMPEEVRAKLTACLAKVSLDFHALLWDEGRLTDFANLDIPTLVLRGSLAHPPSRRIVDKLADTLPRVQTAVVDGAGHMAPITHPDAVNEHIANHLIGAQHGHRFAALPMTAVESFPQRDGRGTVTHQTPFPQEHMSDHTTERSTDDAGTRL